MMSSGPMDMPMNGTLAPLSRFLTFPQPYATIKQFQKEGCMKKSLTVFMLFLCFFVSMAYAAVGERHVEQAGGFSLQAPNGWEFREFPGMKYRFAFGPVKDGFSSNINVVDEIYKDSLKSYVDANIQNLKKALPQFKLIERKDFATNSGLKGEKLVTSSFQQQIALRQTFYFLPGPQGRQFVVTCTTLEAKGESLDAVFDESVKTFAFTK
jgi:hypothetical protein